MLVLPSDLVQGTATQSLQVLSRALTNAPEAQVTVDASALTRLDSTALAVCLELRRLSTSADKTLAWQGMPSRLLDVARLYGIAELLPAQV